MIIVGRLMMGIGVPVECADNGPRQRLHSPALIIWVSSGATRCEAIESSIKAH
jgi:hypothetical protein